MGTSRQDRTRTFLLTRPSRGVTKPGSMKNELFQFLLTRPSRGVTCPAGFPDRNI